MITRAPDNGGNVSFNDFETLEASYAKQEIHPGDLKAAVELELNKLLEPIRKTFESPELKKLVEKAYPQPSKASKFFVESCSNFSNEQILQKELLPRLVMKLHLTVWTSELEKSSKSQNTLTQMLSMLKKLTLVSCSSILFVQI